MIIGLTPYTNSDPLYKFNRSSNSTKPAYIRIPLVQQAPHNFWFSDSGYDLAVLPIPPTALHQADFVESSPERVLTAKKVGDHKILPGAVVIACVLQYEYLDQQDFDSPQATPLLRCAHLSRLGLHTLYETNTFTRCHVIDLHSSHGNSGAPVWVFSSDGATFFLGLIQGFQPEQGARTYDAPLTNKVVLTFRNVNTAQTNQFAIVTVPEANPNLTFVTPVDELTTILKSPQFHSVLLSVDDNLHAYAVEEQVLPP